MNRVAFAMESNLFIWYRGTTTGLACSGFEKVPALVRATLFTEGKSLMPDQSTALAMD
jgi:hypothetical protein